MELKHVAIIMDGNGRWAQNKGLSRTQGHKEGLETAKRIVKTASELNIKYLTLYVFSSENWKRSSFEVGFLMNLVEKHLIAEFQFYKDNNIKVDHIGDLEGLPKAVQKAILKVKDETKDFLGTTVILAINYGSQNEILQAASKYADDVLQNSNRQALTSECFESYLYTKNLPPVDLIIRTGGEKRLSNFLLYQSAYSELFFSDKLWPDWTSDDFKAAISDFNSRNRRFGNAK